jgi:hypothetical protein
MVGVVDEASSLIGENRRDIMLEDDIRGGGALIIARSLIFSLTASFSLLKRSKSAGCNESCPSLLVIGR